jgi:hypothetical protein
MKTKFYKAWINSLNVHLNCHALFIISPFFVFNFMNFHRLHTVLCDL